MKATKKSLSQGGERMRQARILKGLSITDLARLVYTDPSHLSGVESGKRKGSNDLLKRVAEALEIENWKDLID